MSENITENPLGIPVEIQRKSDNPAKCWENPCMTANKYNTIRQSRSNMKQVYIESLRASCGPKRTRARGAS